MATFHFKTGKVSSTKDISNTNLSSTKPQYDLDALLADDISSTKVSDTKDISSTKAVIPSFSSTKVSDTNLSSTNLSSTKDIEETANISSTKVSSTKYMNEYKREKYDTLRLDFPKGTKADWKREADARGISVTKMVKIAVEQYLGGAL